MVPNTGGLGLDEAGITLFAVPHLALGAELTTNYHERSRLFGLRHAAFTLGSILALVSMQIFINAEAKGPEATRYAAEWISWLASGLMPSSLGPCMDT